LEFEFIGQLVNMFVSQVDTLTTAFQQSLNISSSHEGDTTEAKQPV